MQKITVHIKNCYGIRSFDAEFDFSKKKANLIYAPNGMMKTSFARTFKDYSDNIQSKDRMYPDRNPVQKITDENSNAINVDEIFVIEPYVSDYESSRISTLMVNKTLKSEYDRILKTIESKEKDFVQLLRDSSGINKGLEDIVSIVFSKEKDNFLRALERVRTEVNEEESLLANISYINIFNEKVEKFLSTKDLKDKLSEYTKNYDSLLDNSAFFRKGIFNHYQAGEIARQLKTHGFFKADHTIYLNADTEKKEITSEDQLKEVIADEMRSIMDDPKLKKSFTEIDTKLKANQDLRSFREFLLNNMSIIPELTNPELFKEKLWKAYIIKHIESFNLLMAEYDNGKKRIEEITDTASTQVTKWQEVINIFNSRFSVPFKVSIANKQDVILKRDTPNIEFQFSDEGGEPVSVDRKDLIDILSNGEKRALYILNIIFEVEARKQGNIPTLFIVDDIADSFDYKNKYAIVEYLHDILHEGDFKQIILTHNYDFYRTIWKRFDLNGANFHISKNAESISLIKESMYKDPFQKWKAQIHKENNEEILIAMIPFVRNLAEYCGFDEEFKQLTSLLHIKRDTDNITVKSLIDIFGKILKGQDFGNLTQSEDNVKNLIFNEATKITQNGSFNDLEKKIVLSISIRLKAEEFLISKINNPDLVANINSNQTDKLIKEYKVYFESIDTESDNIKLIEQVNLMTPENIHINSFMFEPLLDMSGEHLSRLHKKIDSLEVT
ncbi:hypothetical protein BJAS_P3675 [Bathymodiolus japonicus methanotrophic gill symbiont]|uniref:hypothetical protein n=1 Tax=Bathymodiolus japonicus methanotrophic gill symbiont TaxID=113269 RepID=UPI001B4A3414|nr:hypothetical protein [Bathymodiolus japonicus methanotrophic gill symbiont]GFO73086.1 hypothetical protein BJAS_P3675 [Bathymodiolus japonicus methanotrophic gill symbiont]